MIKHVGKVGLGTPISAFFCRATLGFHSEAQLELGEQKRLVGGGRPGTRRRSPCLRPAGLLVRSLWERASPAARQAPDGHQRARDRGAHGAMCSAPRGARPRGRRRECQSLSPRPRRRLGPGRAVPGDRAAFEGALLWNPEASCRDEAGDPDAVAVVLGTRPSHGIGDAAGTSGPWQSGSGSWAPRAAASCACARPLRGCSGSPACTRAGTLVSVPAPWSSSLA